MDDALRAVVLAHQWLSQYLLETTGITLSPQAFLLLPFFVPAFLALAARNFVTMLAICGFAWVGANFVPAMAFSSKSVVLYVILLFAAFCAAANAFFVRVRLSRTRARCDALTHALKDANGTLDRERFWRRVNGDDRDAIPDDEIRILWERLENSFKSGNELAGVSRR